MDLSRPFRHGEAVARGAMTRHDVGGEWYRLLFSGVSIRRGVVGAGDPGSGCTARRCRPTRFRPEGAVDVVVTSGTPPSRVDALAHALLRQRDHAPWLRRDPDGGSLVDPVSTTC